MIHRMTSFWTFVGVVASVATALIWDGASPTDPVVAVESFGSTPIPSQPPLSLYDREMVPMPGKHIFARALTDQLCGYVNGEAWSCAYSRATCTSSSAWLGCCYSESTGTICGFETTCIGAVGQSTCGVSCLSNTLMVKCTRSTAPYCILYTDTEARLSGWGCTRYSGLTEPIVVNSAITIASEPPVQVPSLTSLTSPTMPSDTEKPQPTVTGDNVGAIAGSVVGGLAVVVLSGLGLFLVLSHRKKNAAAAAALGLTANQPGAPPAQPMVQQPAMQPIHSGGYPDQIWNNQFYASAAQPQMMPLQQSHQAKYAGSEVTTPVNGPPQYGAQPQLQYPPPQ